VLSDTRDELVGDFKEEDIADNMGDVDFANDFAETLWASLDKLRKECDKVTADCIGRKERLGKALIGVIKEEEEAAELAGASKEGKIMGAFAAEIADPCLNYLADASEKLADGVKAFGREARLAADHKLILTRYAGSSWHAAKGKIIDIAANLRDGQRTIGSAARYMDKTFGLMLKRASSPQWKFQLKYSTKIGPKCVHEGAKIQAGYAKMLANHAAFAKSLKSVATAFRSAKADIAKWDCEVMYPKPERTSIDWLGLITDAGKKGFEIYNQAKDLVAGMKGADGIPGLPAGIGGGSPAEETTDLRLVGGDTDEDWAKRLGIWKSALRQCNADRAIFEEEINKTGTAVGRAAKHEPFGAAVAFPEGMADVVDAHKKAALAAIKAGGEMTKMEQADTKAALTAVVAKVEDTIAAAKKAGEVAMAMQAKILK